MQTHKSDSTDISLTDAGTFGKLCLCNTGFDSSIHNSAGNIQFGLDCFEGRIIVNR